MFILMCTQCAVVVSIDSMYELEEKGKKFTRATLQEKKAIGHVSTTLQAGLQPNILLA